MSAPAGFAASVVAREPVSQSRYESLVAKEAARYLPVAIVAKELAEWERAWGDEDLEPVGPGPDNLVVKDEAWERLCAEAEAKLRTAVLAGEIESRGGGKRLSIRWGSYESWTGRLPGARPEWSGAYEIVADERSGQAQADLTTLGHLRDAIQRSPMQRTGMAPSLPEVMVELGESLLTGVALRWSEVSECEAVLREVADDFGCEDPLKPVLREVLDRSKTGLQELHAALTADSTVLVLPEPAAEGLESLRELVRARRR